MATQFDVASWEGMHPRVAQSENDVNLACVASVSVLFRSKERPRNEILGFGRPRMKREAKNERGERGRGRKETLADKIPGFVCKRFLPFFPTPSPLTRAIFRVAFAPKQHGNACFAG